MKLATLPAANERMRNSGMWNIGAATLVSIQHEQAEQQHAADQSRQDPGAASSPWRGAVGLDAVDDAD